MRRLALAVLTVLTLAGCAGTYVGADMGPRRVTEPAAPPYP